MPPRTTRKSDRRTVSDRTMVGTAQPLCLFASATQRRRQHSTMNLRKRQNHSVSSHDLGWTATPCPVAAEPFVLTSPFIERDSRRPGIAVPHAEKPDLSGVGPEGTTIRAVVRPLVEASCFDIHFNCKSFLTLRIVGGETHDMARRSGDLSV